MMGDVNAKLATIRLLAMDVDGVLTDGSIIYDEEGRELKRFHTLDGLGLTALKFADIEIAWITGRSSPAVLRRARELRIEHVLQGVRDKGAALRDLSSQLGVVRADVAYIGDDWNDLLAFESAGVRIAVSNAAAAVKDAADLITTAPGGSGAVREVCDRLLEAQGRSSDVISLYLASLREGAADATAGQ
jgi:3-deoxy-D-manno-octulosonate 8-phosphate phosphatase (KDO 8-P phosphatase)